MGTVGGCAVRGEWCLSEPGTVLLVIINEMCDSVWLVELGEPHSQGPWRASRELPAELLAFVLRITFGRAFGLLENRKGRLLQVHELTKTVMSILRTTSRTLRLAVACLLSGWVCLALAKSSPMETGDSGARVTVASATPDWQVDLKDNLCGLCVGRQLSAPARVELQELMDSTPEMRRVRIERIDEASATYTQLIEAARKRVLRACELERQAGGWCSVWSRIRHRRGHEAPVITLEVARRIAEDIRPVEVPGLETSNHCLGAQE